MSQAELDDYNRFPDTYFGVHLQQRRRTETPLELFDFFCKSYKSTPKEKLLEFMAAAQDFFELSKLSQKELCEIYCERLVYGVMAQKQVAAKGSAPEAISPANT